MLVVMFILGVIASVVLPEFSSRSSYKLETASRELVNAIRFAREESIRTGNPHGIILSSTDETAKVYELIAGTATYNIYHPIDKKLYTLDMRNRFSNSWRRYTKSQYYLSRNSRFKELHRFQPIWQP